MTRPNILRPTPHLYPQIPHQWLQHRSFILSLDLPIMPRAHLPLRPHPLNKPLQPLNLLPDPLRPLPCSIIPQPALRVPALCLARALEALVAGREGAVAFEFAVTAGETGELDAGGAGFAGFGLSVHSGVRIEGVFADGEALDVALVRWWMFVAWSCLS